MKTCRPVQLRLDLSGHVCFTVTYCGWDGKQNGELLNLAAAQGFEALVTLDAGMQYQQHQASLPLAVVILKARTNRLRDLRPLVPALLAALEDLTPNAATIVE